jgi:hypothetical protein
MKHRAISTQIKLPFHEHATHGHEKDFKYFCKRRLVSDLIDKMTDLNFIDVDEETDTRTGDKTYKTNIVVIDHEDYIKLRSTLEKHNFNVMDDKGNIIRLFDLL